VCATPVGGDEEKGKSWILWENSLHRQHKDTELKKHPSEWQPEYHAKQKQKEMEAMKSLISPSAKKSKKGPKGAQKIHPHDMPDGPGLRWAHPHDMPDGLWVNQQINVDTEESIERGVIILGPAESGNKEELRVKFRDGTIDDWPIDHIFRIPPPPPLPRVSQHLTDHLDDDPESAPPRPQHALANAGSSPHSAGKIHWATGKFPKSVAEPAEPELVPDKSRSRRSRSAPES